MLAFLSSLLGLAPSVFTTINQISAQISNLQLAKVQAQTADDKASLDTEIATLQAQRDVLIEDAKHSKADLLIRSWIGAAVAILLTKLLVWDLAIGSFAGCSGRQASGLEGCGKFVTDNLGDHLWQVVVAVVGFYFLASASIAVSRILKP